MDGWNVIAEYEPQSSAGLKPAQPSPSKKASASRKAPAASSTKATAPTEASGHALKHMTTLSKRHVWSEDVSRTLQGAGGIGGLISSTHFRPSSVVSSEISNLPSPINLFFSFDSNGNVILLTDAQCITAANYKYDAFGKTIHATGPAANRNRHRFSTKPVELASGLTFYGYRYYDLYTGQWPSRDPLGLRDTINDRQFTHNNSVNLIDRLGLSASGQECPNICTTYPSDYWWRPRVCCGGQWHDYFSMPQNIAPPTDPSLYRTYFPIAGSCCSGGTSGGEWISSSDAQNFCCKSGQKIQKITLASALGLSVSTCASWISGEAGNASAASIISELGGRGCRISRYCIRCRLWVGCGNDLQF